MLQKYERAYQTLQSLVSGLSDTDAHDALTNAVCKDKTHEEVCLGLLTVILTEPHNAAKSYRDLTMVSRDGLAIVLVHLTNLILERYLRFQDVVRNQVLWLVREMIKNAVNNVDNVCWNIMRLASGGDVTHRNICLIETLLDIFQEHRAWLDKFPLLIGSVVYTYLRLIEDHTSPALANLRDREVKFVVNLIRERFSDILNLGRDFVRLLQNVARIPEIEQLWTDILKNPKSLCPTFNGILQLLQTRTSRRYLQSRLTPDMERKLVFLTSQVRFGNHKRYQDWFQRQYLATPESQSLRSDFIRFIVSVIHPTNELLCSDIIPRWAVIGWLLTTCTANVAGSNSKLSLFYDWLFFSPENDNIMNIEPAILVMHNSMRSHPAVTAALLDFLCRIIPNFYPTHTDKVRMGVLNSLRQIVEKRVLPNLYPLFDNVKLDRELKAMVRETFKEFCAPESFPVNKIEDVNMEIINNTNNHVFGKDEAVFSDEEDEPPIVIHSYDTDDDDIPLSKVRLKEEEKECETEEEDDDPLGNLQGSLRSLSERLLQTKTSEEKCAAVEAIIKEVLSINKLDDDTLESLSNCLCTALQDTIHKNIFPESVNEETLNESISGPLFVLFRTFYQLYQNEDKKRRILISILAEMYLTIPQIGYLLLYFLKVHGQHEYSKSLSASSNQQSSNSKQNNLIKGAVYKDFSLTIEKKLDTSLLNDLKLCQEDNGELLLWLTPEVYREFKTVTINNIAILHIIVQTVDAGQLQDLVCHILQGRLVMFKNETLQPLLLASLMWETFEQYALWQLIAAHDVPLENVLPILPKLDFKSHAEALTSILLRLKQEEPTADLLKLLFCREVRAKGDMFVISVLKYWCLDYEDKLGDLLSNLLNTRNPGTSPNKRKRLPKSGISSQGSPSIEQVEYFYFIYIYLFTKRIYPKHKI